MNDFEELAWIFNMSVEEVEDEMAEINALNTTDKEDVL